MSTQVGDWDRLPVELKSLAQWAIAGPDKAPYTIDSNTGRIYHASPSKGPWLTFETACWYARHYGVGVGFMLTATDGLTCIDMDVKDAESVDNKGNKLPPEKWTPLTELERYAQAVYTFGSYAELSASGKGLHVWVKGYIGAGVKKSGFEVYSQERFIICTGNALSEVSYEIQDAIARATVVNNQPWPLEERTNILQPFVEWLRNLKKDEEAELVELEPEKSDAEIYKMALAADNGDKFSQLWQGQWIEMGFPSQSEADLALLSMFTFYSKSNEQCRRLFRMSGLGQRDKAVKNNRYIDRTLRIIRGRQNKEERVQVKIDLEKMKLNQRLREEAEAQTKVQPTSTQQLIAQINSDTAAKQVEAIREISGDDQLPDAPGLPWPPGMIGALAGFIYNSSPRPVKEVSIVSALGLIAGIAGKPYTIPQSGLNVYIILVARSGVGKEAMHSGIGIILNTLRDHGLVWIDRYANFSDFASGPALVKACTENKSFVNVSGEWGRKLKRLSQEDGRDGPMAQLRTVMTNLYQKSGPASVVGGISYSNKEQNVASVSGVAYSMIGETTPGTLYDSLTKSMMEDGFLSRFTIIEYNGKRPPPNENPITTMDNRLLEALKGLAMQAESKNSSNTTIPIETSPEAKQLLDAFNRECDEVINGHEDEAIRQMWNRAHLKVLRIAGLCAAADHFSIPVIQLEHAEWALDVVRRDIAIMKRKLEDGDVGMGDDTRERKLAAVAKQYLTTKLKASYKINPDMHKDGIIPRKFFQTRTANLSSFSQHRLGASAALDMTLKSMMDSGYFVELDKTKATEKYGFQGRCFQIVNLPEYGE